jgi:hypothetical protein
MKGPSLVLKRSRDSASSLSGTQCFFAETVADVVTIRLLGQTYLPALTTGRVTSHTHCRRRVASLGKRAEGDSHGSQTILGQMAGIGEGQPDVARDRWMVFLEASVVLPIVMEIVLWLVGH